MSQTLIYNQRRYTWAQTSNRCTRFEDSRDNGAFMPHDVNVGSEMARIVTGGDIEPGTIWSEQDFYDAERLLTTHSGHPFVP